MRYPVQHKFQLISFSVSRLPSRLLLPERGSLQPLENTGFCYNDCLSAQLLPTPISTSIGASIKRIHVDPPVGQCTRLLELSDLPEEQQVRLLEVENNTTEFDWSTIDNKINSEIVQQTENWMTHGIDVGLELTKKTIFECPGSHLDQLINNRGVFDSCVTLIQNNSKWNAVVKELNNFDFDSFYKNTQKQQYNTVVHALNFKNNLGQGTGYTAPLGCGGVGDSLKTVLRLPSILQNPEARFLNKPTKSLGIVQRAQTPMESYNNFTFEKNPEGVTPSEPPELYYTNTQSDGGYILSSGGSNWGSGGSNWGSGGSNWGSGGSNWDSGNSGPNAIFLIFLGGGVIVIGKLIYQYGYQLIEDGLNKFFAYTRNKLTKFKKNKNKTKLTSLYSIFLTGAYCAVVLYIFNPERLREIIALLEEVITLIFQEFGNRLMQVMPPQLFDLAYRIGHLLELIGARLRFFIFQIVIPAVLLIRKLTLLGLQVYFIFQFTALGVQLYGYIFKKVPNSVITNLQNVVGTTADASIDLFVYNFLKSSSLALLAPLTQSLIQEDFKIVRLAFLASSFAFVVIDPFLIVNKFAQFLFKYPPVVKLVSCIIGRWCLILLVGDMIRSEPNFKIYVVPFGFVLYFLRVYELAFSASSNMLPL